MIAWAQASASSDPDPIKLGDVTVTGSLRLRLYNRPLAARQGDTENIRIDTFGGHSLHVFTTSEGTWDLLAWGAVQTGRWGTEQQRAYAIDFEGGWQPEIVTALNPWVRAGYTKGSRDGNPKDNTHGRFFPVLPTPGPMRGFPLSA